MSETIGEDCTIAARKRIHGRDDGYIIPPENTSGGAKQPFSGVGAQYAETGSGESVAEPVAVVVYSQEAAAGCKRIGAYTPAEAIFHPDKLRSGKSHTGVPGREGVIGSAVRAR